MTVYRSEAMTPEEAEAPEATELDAAYAVIDALFAAVAALPKAHRTVALDAMLDVAGACGMEWVDA